MSDVTSEAKRKYDREYYAIHIDARHLTYRKYFLSEKGRATRKRWWDKLRADPIRFAEYKAKQRIIQARHKHKHEARHAERKRRERFAQYGISEADFDARLSAQGGGCAICGGVSQKMHVDHSHDDGHVRGILCVNCNVGIGSLGDGIAGLERALVYLRENY